MLVPSQLTCAYTYTYVYAQTWRGVRVWGANPCDHGFQMQNFFNFTVSYGMTRNVCSAGEETVWCGRKKSQFKKLCRGWRQVRQLLSPRRKGHLTGRPPRPSWHIAHADSVKSNQEMNVSNAPTRTQTLLDFACIYHLWNETDMQVYRNVTTVFILSENRWNRKINTSIDKYIETYQLIWHEHFIIVHLRFPLELVNDHKHVEFS